MGCGVDRHRRTASPSPQNETSTTWGGSSRSDLGDAWVSIEGQGQNAFFGAEAVGVPDLDGDGADELLVAAPSTYAGSSPAHSAPVVYLYQGLSEGDYDYGDADYAYVGDQQGCCVRHPGLVARYAARGRGGSHLR